MHVLLRVLDFARVEGTDARYLVALVHNGRCLPLCLREHNIDKVLEGERDILGVNTGCGQA